MSYVVLARKWRPQTFDDLVGQEHVSRTLENAIARQRVAHAFLFTGVRGVGKTTSARILAKALNCVQGPTAKPCLECAPCEEIGDGRDVDVQEIDGASYTGVDAVRSLQETIPYRPARDRYKIYIVDEVHMLSQAAWNAFLKTLEEPPPHVKFLFATTEVNKVPVTILSRCQRYDFKLIRTQEIVERLRYVLGVEEVEADDEAVRIVAREAAGSMRDAMSLLDQVIAWSGGTERLTAEGVARVLGVASRSVLHDLAAAVVDGQADRCLEIVASLAQRGFPLSNVARDFLEHLRQLVVAKVSKEPAKLLELPDEEVGDVLALAERAAEDDLSRLYLGFSRAYDDIVRSAQVRGAFEMALVRLAHRPPLVPVDELLRRLAELEARLGGGGGGGRSQGGDDGRSRRSGGGGGGGARSAKTAGFEASPAPAGLAGGEQGTEARPPSGGASEKTGGFEAPPAPAGLARGERSTEARPPSVGASEASPPGGAGAKTPPSPGGADGKTPPSPGGARAKTPSPGGRNAGAAADVSGAAPFDRSGVAPPDAADATEGRGSEGRASTERPRADVERPANGHRQSVPTTLVADAPLASGRSTGAAAETVGGGFGSAPASTSARPMSAGEVELWNAILDRVREENAHVASIFEHAAPLSLEPERIVLGYEAGSFLYTQAAAPEAKGLLTRAASTHFGTETEIELDETGRHTEVQTMAQKNTAEAEARLAAARKRVEDHPLVVAAREVLGAELRDVRLPPG